MIIVAKFSSVCPKCGTQIAVGSKVEWVRGNKATHVACAGTGTATVSTRCRARGARYCEGWGADNPHAPRPPYTCDECEDQ